MGSSSPLYIKSGGDVLIYYGDAVADEVIRNRTICVKVGNKIRNLKQEEDIHKELLVFVNNIPVYGNPVIYHIQRDEAVRYAKVPL